MLLGELLSCETHWTRLGRCSCRLEQLLESRRRGRVENSARRRLGLDPIALTDPDLERVEELASLDEEILRRVASLPPAQRVALVSRVVEERSYEQIASELRCSQSVIRQPVSRGLKALRTEMEDQ